MKENILIRITGKQKDKSGEENQIELTTEGTIYDKGDNIYIVYEETEISGMEGTTTTLKIEKDNKGLLKRYGTNVSTMVFEEGKRSNTLYQTMFGDFEMEVFTDKVDISLNRDKKRGKIQIDYDLFITGMVESKNQLNIRF
ncbi:DUF1934 domain-containing protein [Alkaliphilus serpentinus]|uniref:DUF1934 domain-containing protein n=1 Tax=Alkaliphilus serpentinus TaxID=1482731 RepID=A0A833HR24_9FIRM|nr:DUF1934 domain-containing protein [Alkaliphilus serpentinus]KAB3532476.1 DUF1934 domain-containing protein [Alkaliphilus serpentinus]